MIHIQEIIVVEGRYDKNTLSQLIDATIVCTNGFSVFRNSKMQSMLRKLAEERGIIILTDSDGAGTVIRRFLNGICRPETVKNAFIPDVLGKEKRKSSPSKEGKLGVEGMPKEVLLRALRTAGATMDESEDQGLRVSITKYDLYCLGLLGGESSAEKRKVLQKTLDLPEKMSSNQLTQVLSILFTLEELKKHLERCSLN